MINFSLIKPIKHFMDRGRQFFKLISVRERFICFFLLLSLTPVLIIGSISNNSLKKVVTDKIARYSLAELSQTVVNIQLRLAEYETISLQLFVNKDFNNTLENYADSGNGPLNITSRKTVETYFNEYMTNKKDLYGFIFFNDSDNGDSIMVTKDFHKDFISLCRSFKRTGVYHDIMKADGGIVWSTPIKIERNNFIILGRLIKRMSNGQPLGILAIIIDEDRIDQLANLTIYNELNNSLNGIENYSLVINDNGEIISSPFKEDIGKNVSQIMGNTLPLKPVFGNTFSAKVNKIDQGSFISKVNNHQSLVTYKAIGSKNGIGGKSGWYLVNLAPTSFLYEERQTVALTTLILCLIFGILAVWISFYVTKMIYSKQSSKSCR